VVPDKQKLFYEGRNEVIINKENHHCAERKEMVLKNETVVCRNEGI
jgi:hypothetical protein